MADSTRTLTIIINESFVNELLAKNDKTEAKEAYI